jgi:hypothetical protein
VRADRHAYAHPVRDVPEVEAWACSRRHKVREIIVDALHDGSLQSTPGSGGWSLSLLESIEELRGVSRLEEPNAPDDRVVWRASLSPRAQIHLSSNSIGEPNSWVNTVQNCTRRRRLKDCAVDLGLVAAVVATTGERTGE